MSAHKNNKKEVQEAKESDSPKPLEQPKRSSIHTESPKALPQSLTPHNDTQHSTTETCIQQHLLHSKQSRDQKNERSDRKEAIAELRTQHGSHYAESVDQVSVNVFLMLPPTYKEVSIYGEFNRWQRRSRVALQQVGKGRLYHCVLKVDSTLSRSFEYKYLLSKGVLGFMATEERHDNRKYSGQAIVDIIGRFELKVSDIIIAMGDLVYYFRYKLSNESICDYLILLQRMLTSAPVSSVEEGEVWALEQLFLNEYPQWVSLLTIRAGLETIIKDNFIMKLVQHQQVPSCFFQRIVRQSCSRRNSTLLLEIASITLRRPSLSFSELDYLLRNLQPELLLQLLSQSIPVVYETTFFERCINAFNKVEPHQLKNVTISRTNFCWLLKSQISSLSTLLDLLSCNCDSELDVQSDLFPVFLQFLERQPPLLPKLFSTKHFSPIIASIAQVNLLSKVPTSLLIRSCVYLISISPDFQSSLIYAIRTSKLNVSTIFSSIELPQVTFSSSSSSHFTFDDSPNLADFLTNMLPQVADITNLLEPGFNLAFRIFGNSFRHKVLETFLDKWRNFFASIRTASILICDVVFVRRNFPAFEHAVPVQLRSDLPILHKIHTLYRELLRIQDLLVPLSQLSAFFGFVEELDAVTSTSSTFLSSSIPLSSFCYEIFAPSTCKCLKELLSEFKLPSSDYETLIVACHGLVNSVLFKYFQVHNQSDVTVDCSSVGTMSHLLNVSVSVSNFINSLGLNSTISFLTPWSIIDTADEMEKELMLLSLVDSNNVLVQLKDILLSFIYIDQWRDITKCFNVFLSGFIFQIDVDSKLLNQSVLNLDDSSFTLQHLQNIQTLLVAERCLSCSYPIPAFLLLLSAISQCSELLVVLDKRNSTDPDTLANLLVATYADFVAGDATKNAFINLLRDPKSLWNQVLKNHIKRSISLNSLLKQLHDWSDAEEFTLESIVKYCDDLVRLNGAASRIDQLLEADGQVSLIIQLISNINFQNGTIKFDFHRKEVSLSFQKPDREVINVSPSSFKEVRSEAILYQSSAFSSQSSTQLLNDKAITDFLNMCTYCSDSLEKIDGLDALGYPISLSPRFHEVKVSEMQSFSSFLLHKLERFTTLLEVAQKTSDFCGLTGCEVFNFILGRNLDTILNLFPNLTRLSNSINRPSLSTSIKLTDNIIESRLSSVLESCSQSIPLKERSVEVYRVPSLDTLFYAALVLSRDRNVHLELTNVLVGCSESTPLSVSSFLCRSFNKTCILLAPEQLSFKCLETVTSFVNGNVEPISLIIITCSENFSRSLKDVSFPVWVDSKPSIEVPSLLRVFRSKTPGQGKTTEARLVCGSNLLCLSGPICFHEILSSLNCSKFDTSKGLLLEVNEPLDVLKQTFLIETFKSANFIHLESEFYNLCVVLFSLMFLGGVRINGNSFLLKMKLCLEFPAVDCAHEFDWPSFLLSIVLPPHFLENNSHLLRTCCFDPQSFNPTHLSCFCDKSINSYELLLSELRFLGTGNCCDILSLQLPEYDAPHPALHSFRLLDNIITLASLQLLYFNHPESPWKFLLAEDAATIPPDVRKQAIELILAYARHTALLSLRHNESAIIAWDTAFSVHFVFSAHDTSIYFVPDGASEPPALKRFLDTYCSSDRRIPVDSQKLGIIRSFYRTEVVNSQLLTEKFPTFVYTNDCFRKQLIIVTRLANNLPTILVGSSGIGKTFLLRHLVFSLFGNDQLLFELCFNAGTPLSNLFDIIQKANDCCTSLPDKKYPVLFLDEVNASDYMHYVTSIICNRQLNSVVLNRKVRIVVCVNPLQTSGDEKLYSVHKIPWSLRNFVMDFGVLSENDEKQYVRQISSKLEVDCTTKKLASDITVKIHSLLRSQKSVSWMVSLRDVQRAVRISRVLVQLMSNSEFSLWTATEIPRLGLALSLVVTYVFRVNGSPLRDQILRIIDNGFGRHGISDRVKQVMYDFAERIDKPRDIVLNDALVENMFAFFCGILSKAPIIVIGVPGQSKSLALTLLLSFMCKTNGRPSYVRQVYTTAFQGSKAATSESILQVVHKVNEKATSNPSVEQVLIMDELSLMKDAPANPLKTLHSILEPREGTPLFSFVGISNTQFDAAPSSRSIIVQRPEHSKAELKETLIKICGKDGYAAQLVDLHQKLQIIGTEYFNSHRADKHHSFLFGNRDIYAFAKFISTCSWDFPNPNNGSMFFRCYGGLPLCSNRNLMNSVSEQFKKVTKRKLKTDVYRNCLRTAVMDNLQDNTFTARHLLLVGTYSKAVQLLKASSRAHELETMIGSKYEADSFKEYNYHQLSRILSACALGKVVVLKNQENLIGALFDLLNRNYLRFNSKGIGVARVALGNTGNHLCHVHERTRVVIVCSPEELFTQPPALLNRLEKINLNEMTLLPSQEELLCWEELFDKYGLMSIKCLFRTTFLQELTDVSSPLTTICQLLVPSQVAFSLDAGFLAELNAYSSEDRVGFLDLKEILQYHLLRTKRPVRLVVFSNFFGDSIQSISGFSDSVYTCSISSANCQDDLVALIMKAGRYTQQHKSRGPLLLFRLEQHEAMHFTSISAVITENHQLFSNIDIVFTVIQGSGYSFSLLDGYDLFFADAINYESSFLRSIKDVVDFDRHSIPKSHVTDLISRLLVFSLMSSSDIPQNLLKIAFKCIQSIYEYPSMLKDISILLTNVFHEPQFSHLFPAFPTFSEFLSNNMSISLQHSLFDYSHFAVTSTLSRLLTILVNNYMLMDQPLLTSTNFVSWSLKIQLITHFSMTNYGKILDYKPFTPSTICLVPFAPFILKCIKYIVEEEPDNIEVHVRGLPIALGDSVRDVLDNLRVDDLQDLCMFILTEFKFSKTIIDYWMNEFNITDLASVFDFIIECLCSVSRKLVVLTTRFLESRGYSIPMNDNIYSLIGTLLTCKNACLEFKNLVSTILIHVPVPKNSLEVIILKWLRLIRISNFNNDYFALLQVTDMDSIIENISYISSNLTDHTTKLLSALFNVLPMKVLSGPSLYHHFDNPSNSLHFLSSIFFQIFYRAVNSLSYERDNVAHFCRTLSSLDCVKLLFCKEFLFNRKFFLPATIALVSVLDDIFNGPIAMSFETIIRNITESSLDFTTVFYGRMFTLKLNHSLISNIDLPASVLEFSLTEIQDNLTFLRNVLFKLLLSKNAKSEAVSVLTALIVAANIEKPKKDQLLASITFDESIYEPFVSETDWFSDASFVSSLNHPTSSTSFCQNDVRLLVSLKKQNHNQVPEKFRQNPALVLLLNTFENCKKILIPLAEFCSTKIATEFSNSNLFTSFIPGSLPHSHLSRFYMFRDPQSHVRHCTSCFAYLLVGDCGAFGHGTGELFYSSSTRCTACGGSHFSESGTCTTYNPVLISQYGSRYTPGPIMFCLDYCNPQYHHLLHNWIAFNNINHVYELLVIQYLGLLFACLQSPAVLAQMNTIFFCDSALAYIRDFLMSLFKSLAPFYQCTVPQVPFIIALKVRRLSDFPTSFLAQTHAEKRQKEQDIVNFLSSLSNEPLPGKPPTFDLEAKIQSTSQSCECFKKIHDSFIKCLFIATTVNEPYESKVFEKFGARDSLLKESTLLLSAPVVDLLIPILRLCFIARRAATKLSPNKWTDSIKFHITENQIGEAELGISAYNTLLNRLATHFGRREDGKTLLQFACQLREFPLLSLDSALSYFLLQERDASIYLYELIQKFLAVHYGYSLNHLLDSSDIESDVDIFLLNPHLVVDCSVVSDSALIEPFSSTNSIRFPLTEFFNVIISSNLLRPRFVLPELSVPAVNSDARLFALIGDEFYERFPLQQNISPDISNYLNLPVATKLTLYLELTIIFKVGDLLSDEQITPSMTFSEVCTRGNIVHGFQVMRNEDGNRLPFSFIISFVQQLESSFSYDDINNYISSQYKAEVPIPTAQKLRSLNRETKKKALMRLKSFAMRFLQVDEVGPKHNISQWDLGDDSLDFITADQVLGSIKILDFCT
ncbi:hypothetical protein RCL1_002976 [Eukaryota sp. TZLM3-RCL]